MGNDYQTDIIDPGDRFSERAREVCLASHENSPAQTILSGGSNLRAMDGWRWNKPVLQAMIDGTIYEVPQSDGAGGKPQFFTLCNTPQAFRMLGWDPITMDADDVACRGGLPTMMIASNIDVKQITNQNWHLCEALLSGFGAALRQSNLALLTGETAVMPHCITAFCDTDSKEQLVMTWNATCVGLAQEEKAPNGTTIRPGMKIIGLRDEGYRCNGGTKFTNIILETWGPSISAIMDNPEAMDFIKRIVIPSRSYAGTIAYLNGWNLDGSIRPAPATLHGVAHITGGGIWSKLVEILPEGVGAQLDAMPRPASVLLQAQKLASETSRPMTDYECYGTFHGGCGMMLVCEESDVEHIMQKAKRDGHDPYLIGHTTASDQNEVTIRSEFLGEAHLSSLHPH